MANDDLFGEDAKPEQQVQKPAEPNAVAPQIDLSPVIKEIQNLGQRLVAVEQQFQNVVVNQPAPVAVDSSDDDLPTRLLTDPKKVLMEEFQANAKETLAPALGVLFEDRKNEVLQNFHRQIDETFGEGTWEEEFKPEVDKALTNMPPEMAGSRGHLNVMVNAIKGDRFNKLVERGAKLEEAAEKAETARQNEPPSLLGVGHARPEEPSISQDLSDWIKDTNRVTGGKMTVEEWQKDAAMGDTEEDWADQMKVWQKEAE